MSKINELREELSRIQNLPMLTDEDAIAKAKAAFNLYFFTKDIKAGVVFDFDQVMNGARQMISDIMVYSQCDAVRTQEGVAYVPKIGYTIKYDATGLDRLCEDDEELAKILLPYRESKPTSPGLTFVRGKS